ncbi:MAG: hypothetical protein KC940_04995 [Candidatus Omnitrophica bacterium]|nr:hypothetical protein [Candidatus Omnitrophota bacterium]MCA9435867.1 hypothetical protein [Candidatus Omnitrophota bacterium]MCA9439841.1 hypothetical protein [Candidatus Omnitrophota bacterium]MCB9770562.1 hypothetical protein [Candidatus Omnitrophota bacterium]MCB9781790.1 hypothetical protein [Candidatus Omnitrophota bacterium]
MSELPGKIRVQDAALANMVTIAAVLEYLDQRDPGAKDLIENRAREIAHTIREQAEAQSEGNGE